MKTDPPFRGTLATARMCKTTEKRDKKHNNYCQKKLPKCYWPPLRGTLATVRMGKSTEKRDKEHNNHCSPVGAKPQV